MYGHSKLGNNAWIEYKRYLNSIVAGATITAMNLQGRVLQSHILALRRKICSRLYERPFMAETRQFSYIIYL